MTFKKFFILNEKKKEAELLVQQGKLSPEDFEMIVATDPSPQKKFAGWMARQWIAGNVTDKDDLRNTMEEFIAFMERGKTKNKDIGAYKSFSEIKAEVKHLNNSHEGVSASDLEKDYEVVRDDDELVIMVPHTHEASRKLGLSRFAFRKCEEGGSTKDSAWCVTYKAPDHFHSYYYQQNKTFYYLRVMSPKLQHELHKKGFNEQFHVVAIVVSQDGPMEAYDALDHQFDGDQLKKYLKILGVA